MIDHTGIGVANVEHSAAFYDAALGALGLQRVKQLLSGQRLDGIGYGSDFPVFWIDRFHPHSVRQHIAFAAKSRAEVDAFYVRLVKLAPLTTARPGCVSNVIRRLRS
jgi:catechol 2,3-dioxygenase-like lactoylglutathione lyase family enzyme